MSKVKSPQQIMGSMIREAMKEQEPYIVGVMPCFDKKLEAIRFEHSAGVKEVDLVLTSGEVIDLIKLKEGTCSCGGKECLSCQCRNSTPETEVKERFPYVTTLKLQPAEHYGLASDTSYDQLRRTADPKCNGYIFVLMSVLGVKEYKSKQIRNSDFIEYEFEHEGKVVKMAQCFGFRNIQNVVRSLKQKKCEYSYIEIMACPMGCFNGGGQIKIVNTKPK